MVLAIQRAPLGIQPSATQYVSARKHVLPVKAVRGQARARRPLGTALAQPSTERLAGRLERICD